MDASGRKHLWVDPSDNWKRIKDCGLENDIIPVKAEAKALPYAKRSFDAAICIDSYVYYGRDPEYTAYFAEFIMHGRQVCAISSFNGPLPRPRRVKYRDTSQGGTKVMWTSSMSPVRSMRQNLIIHRMNGRVALRQVMRSLQNEPCHEQAGGATADLTASRQTR